MGATGQPVQFEAKAAKNVTLVVTAHDGKKYDVEMAVLVVQVIDSGMTNPLDGMPIFQVGSQIVTQVKAHANGQ